MVENIEALSQSVLQKYISYARRYVKPRITKEAAAVLQNYYLELRRRTDKCGGLCIHNRKLEAMIRLTEVWYFLIFLLTFNVLLHFKEPVILIHRLERS